MTLQVDHLILEALKEDISSEDVTTNSVMKEAVPGEVDLICKEDGIIAGLEIFSRVFTLLDADTKVELFCKDGDEVKKGQKMGKVTGDIRVLLSGERVALNYLQRTLSAVQALPQVLPLAQVFSQTQGLQYPQLKPPRQEAVKLSRSKNGLSQHALPFPQVFQI